MIAAELSNLIRAQAYGLGFDLVGITSLGAVETAEANEEWLRRGFAGDMEYLHRGAEKRRDSRRPFAGATSAIVVGLDYGGAEPDGPVARYARGDDYHDVMVRKLDSVHEWIDNAVGRHVAGKPYVDTGPILERDLARRAGLGWFGKNTNLLNPQLGSYFFIGALLVDLDLGADAPFDADRCGTCTRCIDACPTDALVAPRVLDATRCISYLTIENKGSIPEEFRRAMGPLIYGCDICQEVCPYNLKFAQPLKVPEFELRSALASNDARALATDILAMDADRFRSAFKGSPMKRAKLPGLKRNAAVVLGNVGDETDLPALISAQGDLAPMVQEHASWAIAEIRGRMPPATHGVTTN